MPKKQTVVRRRQIRDVDTWLHSFRRRLWTWIPIWSFGVFRYVARIGRSNDPTESLLHFREGAIAHRDGHHERASRELSAALSFALGRRTHATDGVRRVVAHSAWKRDSHAESPNGADFRPLLPHDLIRQLDSSQSAALSQGLATCEMFADAYHVREHAMRTSLTELTAGHRAETVIRRAIHYLLDLRDSAGLQLQLESLALEGSQLPHGVIAALKALRVWPGVVEIAPSRDDCVESNFASMITDRDVVLIGAAPQGPADWQIVNDGKYDCVVRMTPAMARDSDQTSSDRCDIAYLTAIAPQTARQLELRGYARPLRFLDSETPKLVVMKKARQIHDLLGVPVRSIPNTRAVAIGSPTSGTQAIVDILQYRPKSLEIIGFNFYTSQASYKTSILQRKQSDPLTVSAGRDYQWRSGSPHRSVHAIQWASHDLASDFQFLRAVVALNPSVRALSDARRVLDWTLPQYYQRFAELADGRE